MFMCSFVLLFHVRLKIKLVKIWIEWMLQIRSPCVKITTESIYAKRCELRRLRKFGDVKQIKVEYNLYYKTDLILNLEHKSEFIIVKRILR